jgi:hypothetical protein
MDSRSLTFKLNPRYSLQMLSRISVSRLSKPIQITALVVLAIAQITLSKDTISSPYGIFALCILTFLGYMALKVSIENPIDRQIDYLKQYIKWTNDTQQDFDEKRRVEVKMKRTSIVY